MLVPMSVQLSLTWEIILVAVVAGILAYLSLILIGPFPRFFYWGCGILFIVGGGAAYAQGVGWFWIFLAAFGLPIVCWVAAIFLGILLFR